MKTLKIVKAIPSKPLYYLRLKRRWSIPEWAEALTKLIYDPTLDIGRFNGNKKLVYKKGLDKYIEQNRRLI